jgi:hypothetical protein
VNDSYESFEITVNGIKVKVCTYSVGLERVIVLDRYDDICVQEILNIVNYLRAEGFLFSNSRPKIEIVKTA